MITKALRKIRIEIKKSKDDQWYFTLLAGNGETIAFSETYTREHDARRAAHCFRRLVGLAEVTS